jgi:hypothetical protein
MLQHRCGMLSHDRVERRSMFYIRIGLPSGNVLSFSLVTGVRSSTRRPSICLRGLDTPTEPFPCLRPSKVELCISSSKALCPFDRPLVRVLPVAIAVVALPPPAPLRPAPAAAIILPCRWPWSLGPARPSITEWCAWCSCWSPTEGFCICC